jgi:nucleoside diphosphate kinase
MPNLDPNDERTLVIIKPDGIQRSLVGEIIHRYERTGLKLLAIKMVILLRKWLSSTIMGWGRMSG